jgi:uncharacterized membrane-anchored protein
MPESFNKVPEVTLAFWIIKIAAYNTRRNRRRYRHDDPQLGLFGGNRALPRRIGALVGLQIIAKSFIPSCIGRQSFAFTTFGTTKADFAEETTAALP